MSETRSVYDHMGYLLQEFPEWAGLDYDSAVGAMPRLYGVSFGNGNDGVSHRWPNYYVRTCEPYILAAAAMLSDFHPGEGQVWCAEHCEVDGEATYGISATLYNPPDDREDYEAELEIAREAVAAAKIACDEASDDDEQAQIDLEERESELEELEATDSGSWSEHNGAWVICEVFPVDDVSSGAPYYTSLAECFTAELITLAREV